MARSACTSAQDHYSHRFLARDHIGPSLPAGLWRGCPRLAPARSRRLNPAVCAPPCPARTCTYTSRHLATRPHASRLGYSIYMTGKKYLIFNGKMAMHWGSLVGCRKQLEAAKLARGGAKEDLPSLKPGGECGGSGWTSDPTVPGFSMHAQKRKWSQKVVRSAGMLARAAECWRGRVAAGPAQPVPFARAVARASIAEAVALGPH